MSSACILARSCGGVVGTGGRTRWTQQMALPSAAAGPRAPPPGGTAPPWHRNAPISAIAARARPIGGCGSMGRVRLDGKGGRQIAHPRRLPWLTECAAPPIRGGAARGGAAPARWWQPSARRGPPGRRSCGGGARGPCSCPRHRASRWTAPPPREWRPRRGRAIPTNACGPRRGSPCCSGGAPRSIYCTRLGQSRRRTGLARSWSGAVSCDADLGMCRCALGRAGRWCRRGCGRADPFAGGARAGRRARRASWGRGLGWGAAAPSAVA
jgi:hypothetical protein